MQLIVMAVLLVLRVIAALMFAACFGALTATAVSLFSPGERPDWLGAVTMFAMTVAVIFGAGSFGMSRLMPSTRELIRQRRDREAPIPTPFVLLLTALVGVAVLQVPAFVAWWMRNLTLARVLTGGETDPMGLYLLPTALVVATPTLGCIALVAFVAGGVLALIAPHDFSSRVLGASAMVQGGLVAGLVVIERAVREVAVAVQRLADSSSDRLAAAQVADWLGGYDLSSGWLSTRLVLLLGGFLLALVVSRAVMQRRTSPDEEPAPDVVEPAPSPRPPDPARPAVPPASSDFDDSAYSVRPRQSWLGAWAGKYAQYDIASIPPTSRTRFSLTWKGKTGIVRRDPNGPDLVSVGVQRASLFGGSGYEVADARTGAVIGTLVSSGSDWEIRDSSGRTVAEVKAVRTGVGGSVFVATAGGLEVCRFVWGWAGMTAASAELQIEFPQGAEKRFSKTLGIVLGALLDNQTRRASRWHSH